MRSALSRGWWLVTSVYLVVDAGLSPAQLIGIGVFQGITVVIAEVPAGVVADAVSRRGALVAAHVVMGSGMALTGLVTDYRLLVLSNCLWGLGWALSSGADVAWITDELDDPTLIDRVLTAQSRQGLVGTMVGIVGFGALAWATSLATAMVVAGLAMIGLGVGAVARWPETRFDAVAVGRRCAESIPILRGGISVAVSNRKIGVVLIATLLLNGAAEGFGRLYETRIIGLGIPDEPDLIVWFGGIALCAAALGAATLRLVEARIEGTAVARQVYVGACVAATVGLLIFAHVPNASAAVAGSLLVSGIAFPATRLAATILVNRQASSDRRATMHSMLSQAENLGEIVCGAALAGVAGSLSSSAVLTVSAVLVGCAAVVVRR